MTAPAKISWPPNYVQTYQWRSQTLQKLREDPAALAGALSFYSTHPGEFVDHWCDTYDPRNAGTEKPVFMPMRLFRRQWDLIDFFEACRKGEAHGLIEKCRDMGATFCAAGYSVWMWRFLEGSATGWGSRKEELVDRLGDPKSVFEKIRTIVFRLPRVFLPEGFSAREHSSYMRLVNPDNGATITGEAGDNIGRGGRTLMYFKDESAHYERPELIEAALSDNTRVQIDISSVNGPGNVFHRRRESGVDWHAGQEMSKVSANVFVMDWRDHPDKTQAWYDLRKAKATADGLLHVHAQEIDRNYFAALAGTVIPMEWIRAAVDAHKTLGWELDENDEPAGMFGAALDVADNDGMGDRNALATRKGPLLRSADEWGDRDTAVTARRALGLVEGLGELALQYDCIGVGSGVKAEVNRLGDEGLMPEGVRLVPWDAGQGPQNPDETVIENDDESPLNKDFFTNLKAQGWWELARRFERTWRAVTQGVKYDPDLLISLPSTLPNLRQIEKELAQPTASKGARLKMVIDKTPKGTRSPNIGDAIMMAFWPMTEWEPPVAVSGTWGRMGD